jgi:hypothetical protein
MTNIFNADGNPITSAAATVHIRITGPDVTRSSRDKFATCSRHVACEHRCQLLAIFPLASSQKITGVEEQFIKISHYFAFMEFMPHYVDDPSLAPVRNRKNSRSFMSFS